jgi:hypothetical protein
LFPAPIREKSGKTYTDESARQGVKQKSPEEFFGGNGQLALFVAVRIVLPPKGNLAVGHG